VSENDGYLNINNFLQRESRECTLKCRSCGRILMGGEGYYQTDGKPYCEDCVESADLEDLIRICETSAHTIYCLIGLSHRYLMGDAE